MNLKYSFINVGMKNPIQQYQILLRFSLSLSLSQFFFKKPICSLQHICVARLHSMCTFASIKYMKLWDVETLSEYLRNRLIIISRSILKEWMWNIVQHIHIWNEKSRIYADHFNSHKTIPKRNAKIWMFMCLEEMTIYY